LGEVAREGLAEVVPTHGFPFLDAFFFIIDASFFEELENATLWTLNRILASPVPADMHRKTQPFLFDVGQDFLTQFVAQGNPSVLEVLNGVVKMRFVFRLHHLR